MKPAENEAVAAGDVLGTLDSFVVGITHYRAGAKEGDRLPIVREPGNPHDPNALRVNNPAGRQVGHLPRSLAAFLSPLVDGGAIECRAVALATSRREKRRGRSRLPIRLEVRLGPSGQTLFEVPADSPSPAQVVHELVVKTWRQLAGMEQPETAVRAARQAAEALGDSALPATRLLCSLLADRLAHVDEQRRHERLETVRSFLRSLRFGTPIQAAEVTLLPVVSSNGKTRTFELIDEAVQAEHAIVEEVDTGPAVNTVKVRNVGDRPILAPQGWLLLGAMQDRILVFSLVIDVGYEWAVPVCCVEQGRWHPRSATFTSRSSAPPSLRSASLREAARHGPSEAAAAQSEVWDEVDAMLMETDVPSATRSIADAYQRHEEELRRDRESIQFPKETCGLVALADGEVLGIDLFGEPELFRRAAASLLDGYLLEGVRRRSTHRRRRPRRRTRPESVRPASQPPGPEQAVRRFLDRVASGLTVRGPEEQVGDGWTLTVAAERTGDAPELVGSGVVHDGTLLHLSVFAAPSDVAR